MVGKLPRTFSSTTDRQIICCTEDGFWVSTPALLSSFYLSKAKLVGNAPQRKFLHEAGNLLLSKYDKWRLMFEHPIVALAIMYLQLWYSLSIRIVTVYNRKKSSDSCN